MSEEAFLPCFVCGKRLQNAFIECDNQPYEGTEFRTYGHYGSTFWDSFDGEELIVNICDACLEKGKERLAQQKRFQPVRCNGMMGYGRKHVSRPIVHYTGNPDDSFFPVDEESLGADDLGVEWCDDLDELIAFKHKERKRKENEKHNGQPTDS